MKLKSYTKCNTYELKLLLAKHTPIDSSSEERKIGNGYEDRSLHKKNLLISHLRTTHFIKTKTHRENPTTFINSLLLNILTLILSQYSRARNRILYL